MFSLYLGALIVQAYSDSNSDSNKEGLRGPNCLPLTDKNRDSCSFFLTSAYTQGTHTHELRNISSCSQNYSTLNTFSGLLLLSLQKYLNC